MTLRHASTSGYLHSYKQAVFGHPIAGQREVCAVLRQTKESEWFAAEGIYMPRMDGPHQQQQPQQQARAAGASTQKQGTKAGSAPSKAAGAPGTPAACKAGAAACTGDRGNCTSCEARDEL